MSAPVSGSTAGGERPGRVPEPDILYAEVPHFYAAVECAADATLKGRSVIVGGDPSKRGKVQAASQQAIAHGVEAGMPMADALHRCPDAVRRKTDMKRYREASGALVVCLRRVAGELEPKGLGAVFLATGGRLEPSERTAERMVAAVAQELGLELKVGIAPAKFLARLAAIHAGAAPSLQIRRADVDSFLHPLPVGELPNVGPRTVADLARLGAKTVGELLRLDVAVLEQELGNHGLTILESARGEDRTPVRVAKHPQSISRERSFPPEGIDPVRLSDEIRRLSHSLEIELEKQGLRAGRVAIRLGFVDRPTLTRSITLGEPVRSSADVRGVAATLLERAAIGTRRVRALALTLAGLATSEAETSQLELFAAPRK